MESQIVKNNNKILIVLYVLIALLIISIILLVVLPLTLVRDVNSSRQSLIMNKNILPKPLTKKYTTDTALRLADVAYAAYFAFFDSETMFKWLNFSELNLTDVLQFYDNNTEITGLIANIEIPDKILIAFTGTQAINLPETILDDLDIGLIPFPPTGGQVSKGFYDSWIGVQNYILHRINNSTKEVWLSSHSLGGAVATLAGAAIKNIYPNIKVIIYSFASPRVGDEQFSYGFSRLGIYSNRIQNSKDIIPRLPFNDFLGYVHVETLILLCEPLNNGTITCTYNAKSPDNYIYNPFDWPREHSLITYMNIISTCKVCYN